MPITKPRIDLSEEFRQLALGLELPEVELENVSPEVARQRSEAGRLALYALKGENERPAWFERFESLINMGWPWRQATYIAWASMPKENRIPATQEELARQFLNLTSDRAINTWRRRNPAIDSTVAVMASAELWEFRPDAFKSLIEGMKHSKSDYKFFNHLKLFLEMTGDYVPTSKLEANLKRSGAKGPQDVDDETLTELEAGAKALESNVSVSEEQEDE